MKRRTCNYITASRNHTDVDPVRVLESRGPLKTGVVHVVSKVWGYRKVCRQTFKVLELKEFSLPPLEFDSRGTWVDVPSSAIEKMAALNLDARSGVQRRTRLLIVAPLFVVRIRQICDGACLPAALAAALRRILYDARPGAWARPTLCSDASTRRWARRDDCCPSALVAFPRDVLLAARARAGYNANLDRRAARLLGRRAGGTAVDLSTRRRVAWSRGTLTRRGGRVSLGRVGGRVGRVGAVAAGFSAARGGVVCC